MSTVNFAWEIREAFTGEVANNDPGREIEFHHHCIGGKGAEAQKKSMSQITKGWNCQVHSETVRKSVWKINLTSSVEWENRLGKSSTIQLHHLLGDMRPPVRVSELQWSDVLLLVFKLPSTWTYLWNSPLINLARTHRVQMSLHKLQNQMLFPRHPCN